MAKTLVAFTREHKHQAIALRLEGATIAETAQIIGCAPGTLSNHLKDDQSFRERWDEATRICKEQRARKAHKVVDQILDDPHHKDALNAAKTYLGAYDPDFKATEANPEAVRDNQIAEALDRFTQTVVSLASRGREALPPPEPER